MRPFTPFTNHGKCYYKLGKLYVTEKTIFIQLDQVWQGGVSIKKYGITISVRIIVLNSLRNKYAERNKHFSLQQVKGFYKNREAFFAFCDAILDVNNISHKKQYTMDE